MEIRNLCIYVIVNCAVLVSCFAANVFSSDKELVAESNQKTFYAPIGSQPQHIYVNKGFTTENFSGARRSKDFLKQLPKKEPFSNYKKAYQHKHLAEHNNLIDLIKDHLNKKFFNKREFHSNDGINEKYMQLRKNLDILFNNLFNSELGDSYEISKSKYQRHNYQPQRTRRTRCKCPQDRDSETGASGSFKETTVFTRPHPAKATTDTKETNNTSLGEHRNQRQIKNIPLLLPRDSRSDRRVNVGNSARNRTAFYGNSKRNITRDNGNRQYFPGSEKKPCTSSHAKTAYSHSRIGTSSTESKRRLEREDAIPSNGVTKIEREHIESQDIHGRLSHEELTSHNKLQISGNTSVRQKHIPKYVRRFGRIIPSNKESDIRKPLQPKETRKESLQNVPLTISSDKQITNRHGSTTTENPRISSKEQLISIADLSNLNLALHKINKIQTPAVSIISGYSTANKNGIINF